MIIFAVTNFTIAEKVITNVYGIRYHVPESQIEETLHKLDSDKPNLLLIVQKDEEYGTKLCVRQGLKELGYVSRVCKDDIISSLKRGNKYSTTFAKVAEVYFDDYFFSINVDFDKDEYSSSMVKEYDPESFGEWSGWYLSCPLLENSKLQIETETCIEVLSTAMENKDLAYLDLENEYIDQFLEVSKFDISRETEVFRNRLLSSLKNCPVIEEKEYYSKVYHATTALSSKERIEEFNDVFQRQLFNSKLTKNLIAEWRRKFAPNGKNKNIEDIMEEQRNEYIDSLRKLPYNLYKYIDDLGQFMTHCLYRKMPREKLRIVLSALVLITYFDRKLNNTFHNKLPEELSSEKALEYWQRLYENGFVDEHFQLLETTKVKEATYIAHQFSTRMGIPNRWKPFEEFWEVRFMASCYHDMKNNDDKPYSAKTIDKIFLR